MTAKRCKLLEWLEDQLERDEELDDDQLQLADDIVRSGYQPGRLLDMELTKWRLLGP